MGSELTQLNFKLLIFMILDRMARVSHLTPKLLTIIVEGKAFDDSVTFLRCREQQSDIVLHDYQNLHV